MEFAKEQIMACTQEGTVRDYCDSFMFLFNQVRNCEEFTEFYAIYLFICGLKPRIRSIFVKWHQYSCFNMEDVISLALKIDINNLNDSFSPFDPESSFYMEGLEFDFNKSLWELMEGNECFENGKIQEVDIVQETINNKDRMFGKSAYKVFDEMLERDCDEIQENVGKFDNGNKTSFKVLEEMSSSFINEIQEPIDESENRDEIHELIDVYENGNSVQEIIEDGELEFISGSVVSVQDSLNVQDGDLMDKIENDVKKLFGSGDAKESGKNDESNLVHLDLWDDDIHEKDINVESIGVCTDICENLGNNTTRGDQSAGDALNEDMKVEVMMGIKNGSVKEVVKQVESHELYSHDKDSKGLVTVMEHSRAWETVKGNEHEDQQKTKKATSMVRCETNFEDLSIQVVKSPTHWLDSLLVGFFLDIINTNLFKIQVRVYMWHKWKIKILGYARVFGSNKNFDLWKWKKRLVWSEVVRVCNPKCEDYGIMEVKIVLKLVGKNMGWEVGEPAMKETGSSTTTKSIHVIIPTLYELLLQIHCYITYPHCIVDILMELYMRLCTTRRVYMKHTWRSKLCYEVTDAWLVVCGQYNLGYWMLGGQIIARKLNRKVNLSSGRERSCGKKLMYKLMISSVVLLTQVTIGGNKCTLLGYDIKMVVDCGIMNVNRAKKHVSKIVDLLFSLESTNFKLGMKHNSSLQSPNYFHRLPKTLASAIAKNILNEDSLNSALELIPKQTRCKLRKCRLRLIMPHEQVILLQQFSMLKIVVRVRMLDGRRNTMTRGNQYVLNGNSSHWSGNNKRSRMLKVCYCYPKMLLLVCVSLNQKRHFGFDSFD